MYINKKSILKQLKEVIHEQRKLLRQVDRKMATVSQLGKFKKILQEKLVEACK